MREKKKKKARSYITVHIPIVSMVCLINSVKYRSALEWAAQYSARDVRERLEGLSAWIKPKVQLLLGDECKIGE